MPAPLSGGDCLSLAKCRPPNVNQRAASNIIRCKASAEVCVVPMNADRSLEPDLASSIVERWVVDDPGAPALVGHRMRMTYGELDDQASRLGAAFRKMGCGPGERVLIALPDSAEFVIALFGAWKAGAVPLPVSPFVGPEDFAHYFTETAPRCAVLGEQAMASVPAGTWETVVVGATHWTGASWSDVLAEAPTPAPATAPADPDELALLLYTSGSTKRQKCVMHSHRNIVNACRNIAAHLFQVAATDRVLSIPKPFFAWGLCGGVLFPLFSGATTIVTDGRTELRHIVETIQAQRPTMLIAIPTFLAVLLRARRSMEIDLSSVRCILSAGESLSPALYDTFKADYGIEVFDGIGSTEMLTHFISNGPSRVYPGTCGIEAPGCEAMLVDEHDARVQDGYVGSLLVKAPTAFLGYWHNAAETRHVKAGDWIRTGDNLQRDASGAYRYCGRSDDMLKVGGLWVLSTEVEHVFCEHPKVLHVAVTVREDPSGQRRLVAYIVPRSTPPPTVPELLQVAGARLPAHMIPAAFTILDVLPRTPNGKVKRSALPDPAWRWSATTVEAGAVPVRGVASQESRNA